MNEEQKDIQKDFFVSYSEMNGQKIFAHNSLVSEDYLSFDEFKEKCWKQFLISGVSYQPLDQSQHILELNIGSKHLRVNSNDYPEIHNFFQNASRIYSCYCSKDSLPDDVPLEERECFLNALEANGFDIVKALSLHDTYTPSLIGYSNRSIRESIQNIIVIGLSAGVSAACCFGVLTAAGFFPALGTIMFTIAAFILPNGISHIKFLRCFQKNQKNFNQLLSRYQNAMGEKQLDMEHELSTEKIEDASVEQKEEEIFKAPMSPVITSFQEICASLEKLPDSVQKGELVEQTKDLLNRYQNAIGDISSLEQESERQSQRIKIESAFNNRLVLLRQDILNADQQQRDDIDSIQQLQTLNEQLTAMLLESDDTDVTRKGTNQPKMLRKSASAGQHH